MPAVVRRLVRVSRVRRAGRGERVGIYFLSLRTPTGFLPEEDQGAFFIAVQLPDGASVARTSEAVRGSRRCCDRCRRSRTCSRSSASRCSTASTSRTRLSWCAAEAVRRPHGAANGGAGADRAHLRRRQQIRTATSFPFNLPPIIGLSTSGGFEYQLEALEGQDPAAMGSVMQGLLAPPTRIRG
jgi:multidrug efflux pump subunit AcrB